LPLFLLLTPFSPTPFSATNLDFVLALNMQHFATLEGCVGIYGVVPDGGVFRAALLGVVGEFNAKAIGQGSSGFTHR